MQIGMSEENLMGLGADAPIERERFHIPLLVMAGAAIGAIKAKDGRAVNGAVKGAAIGFAVELGAILLLGVGATAYIYSKYSKLSDGNKQRVRSAINDGTLNDEILKRVRN